MDKTSDMPASDADSPPPNSLDPLVGRRSRRRRFLIGGAVLGVAALVFVLVYFEPQTAFIDDKVSETIPGLDDALAAETAPVVATDVPSEPTTTISTVAEPTVPESAVPEATVPVSTVPPPANSVSAAILQAAATGQPVVLSRGEFFSGEHSTSGTALVVALPDGSLVVRFEGLDSSNGPDLRVVLSPDGASESSDYSNRLIIDELKGNIGDQNYTLGADVDLTQYKSVVIWCERFSVAFGAAPIAVQA